MKKLAAVLIILCASSAHAQTTAYDSAYFAWERGQYITAIDGMLRVLRSSQADANHARIALLTGELFTTTQVAPDGRNVRWSPDGVHFLYETGTAAGRITHVVQRQNRSAIQKLSGYGATFSNDGKQVVALGLEEGSAARIYTTDISARTAAATMDLPQVSKTGLTSYVDEYVFLGTAQGDTVAQIYRNGRPYTADTNRKTEIITAGDRLIYVSGTRGFGIVHPRGGDATFVEGTTPALSRSGDHVAYVVRVGADYQLRVRNLEDNLETTLKTSRSQISLPSFSPNGRKIVYQMMPREDWELFVLDADGKNDRRLTREIQHDQFARFVDDNTVLAVMGESRHRRSYLYNIETGERTRLFHNNTIRTVAPEYQWSVSPDGRHMLIVSDRDGNTISPERGVYLVDLTREVTRAELIERLQAMRTGEAALQAHGRRIFAPIHKSVAAAVSDVSKDRIYNYARDLFAFDSKHITRPGNAQAIAYLEKTLRSFGYKPELQWFEPRPGVRTANIIATLRGTTHPELIYVISSHFDSVEQGPGADDNSSGTTALLEAARVLARRPQATTIKFAFFTGEEAGLLGSREFVRRAVADKDRIVGALNNDMVGWRNDQRLDNTIRYSNDGIRDLQHAAALLFTNLITYDSRYYQNTDAHAYYEAYGDVVGGIGSYPILGNPHYHQPHDVLETVDQQLVAEVSKTTVASIMLLASSTKLPLPVSSR